MDTIKNIIKIMKKKLHVVFGRGWHHSESGAFLPYRLRPFLAVLVIIFAQLVSCLLLLYIQFQWNRLFT